jgi:hypothetical protein
VRVCNKCKKVFEKSDGCNQVKCSCGNYQCYMCSMDVPSDHSHFGKNRKCQLYGDPKIEEHIVQAERETVGRLVRSVPGLSSSDLKIRSVRYTSDEIQSSFR